MCACACARVCVLVCGCVLCTCARVCGCPSYLEFSRPTIVSSVLLQPSHVSPVFSTQPSTSESRRVSPHTYSSHQCTHCNYNKHAYLTIILNFWGLDMYETQCLTHLLTGHATTTSVNNNMSSQPCSYRCGSRVYPSEWKLCSGGARWRHVSLGHGNRWCSSPWTAWRASANRPAMRYVPKFKMSLASL